MSRFVAVVALFAVLCGVQAGCCPCCAPVAFNQPVAVQPPPVVVANPPNGFDPPKENPRPDNKPRIIKYQYDLDTGQLKSGGQVIGTGFSGKGEAKNDRESYRERITGVIPGGDWKVERRRADPKTGEPILDLHLWTGGHVNGRIPGEDFTMHSDASPAAGESGIAMPRNVLDAIEIPKGMFDLAIIEVRWDQMAPPKPKTYTYSQSSGQLKFYGEVLGTGYSGRDKGKNNPAMQHVKNVGPVPVGEYEIISRERDFQSLNAGSKLKLNPVGKVDDRWPAEDIWLATESNPPGKHPAIYIVFIRDAVDRIEFRPNNPRTRLKVVP